MTTTVIGRVVGLWRYPVKSMGGETLSRSEVGVRGMLGDRAFGVIDAATGRLLSAKSVPQLLGASARFRDGQVDMTLPDGDRSHSVASDDDDVDAQLSRWLGRRVRLASPLPDVRSTVEIETDLDDPSVVHHFSTPAGSFFDSRSVLHLLTPSSLRSAAALHPGGQWSVSRFRPNVVVETPEGAQGWVEDAWVDATMELGGVRASGRKPCERCIVTTRRQPGLSQDPEILRTLEAFHDASLGVYLDVVSAGALNVGDEVARVEPDPGQ